MLLYKFYHGERPKKLMLLLQNLLYITKEPYSVSLHNKNNQTFFLKIIRFVFCSSFLIKFTYRDISKTYLIYITGLNSLSLSMNFLPTKKSSKLPQCVLVKFLLCLWAPLYVHFSYGALSDSRNARILAIPTEAIEPFYSNCSRFEPKLNS